MLRVTCMLLSILVLGAALGAASDPNDVPALLKELKSKNAKTRAGAAQALGRMGAVKASDTKEAVPLLIGLVKSDKDASVRRVAADALGRIDPDPKETVPVLLEALKDKEATVRQAAAAALGQFPKDRAEIVPALREMQNDKNKMVERTAKQSLKNLREQKN